MFSYYILINLLKGLSVLNFTYYFLEVIKFINLYLIDFTIK